MSWKVIILGSGAAPGVPAIANGWGRCDPKNPKNQRTRSSAYIEYNNTKILIDTSPDLRIQMLANRIKDLDAVIYTHPHADHLHGIDDLREFNRIKCESLNFYACEQVVEIIAQRFPYLIADPKNKVDGKNYPSLLANIIKPYQPFYIKDLKITPIVMLGHNSPSTGYIFDDGEIVYFADYKHVDEEALRHIIKPVKLMVLPLTTPHDNEFHANIDEVITDIGRIKPARAVINHMAVECDYEEIMRATPENTEPAFDNMVIEEK